MYKLTVYKDYSRRCGAIHFRESAAMQQRNTRRLEIAGGHDNIKGGELLVGRQIRLTLDLQSHGTGSGCRQVGSDCDGLRTWNALEPGKNVPDERGLLRGTLITRAI